MSDATVSRWSRRFVVAGALFLVAWQLGVLAGVPRRTGVVLGLYGFVLHVLFGKGYSLLPAYFDRSLKPASAPAIQFLPSTLGVLGLAWESIGGPASAGTGGAVAWGLGTAVFVGAVLWTVRDNLAGRETGTAEAKQNRQRVDRTANAFVPIALAYLLLGAYCVAAGALGVPTPFDGYPPRVTHLLGAGAATLLLFAVGFRLLPRFLVATPPGGLVSLVLPAGAVGPLLLAATLNGGWSFRVAAAVEATAVVGFAVAYAILFRRSARRRVGFYGVLLGVAWGTVGVLLGLSFAFGSVSGPLVTAHYRINLLGFLGLTIVGVAYQFYPPAIGSFPGASDRTAFVSLACLGGGLLLEVAGLVAADPSLTTAGRIVTAVGAGTFAYLVVALVGER